MKGQTENKLLAIGFLIFAILVCFVFVRLMLILPSMGNYDVCKLENGDNWEYDYSSNFGNTCVELDYISLEVINRTQQKLSIPEAIDKYCEYPGFWELSKWGYECKDG